MGMTIAKSIQIQTVGLAIAVLLGVNAACAQALPPGVEDVVKLSRAGLSDQIILSQIRNNGAGYNLTADQIISLKNQGVSQPVINALLAGGPADNAVPPTAPVPLPSTPAPAVAVVQTAPTLDDFQAQLAPYGTWRYVLGYGRCWQPAITDRDWRPYFHGGHWVYTDAGWSWQSNYPWGDIVFHYGRWLDAGGHWFWVPGYDWAPAWVCWREADGCCGWAPLPPAAEYRTGVGLFFNGRLAVDVDFGLGMDAFAFVPFGHFWDNDLHPYLMPRDRQAAVFRGSHVLNGYRVDQGRFVVEGLGRDHIATVTHHEVAVVRDAHVFHAPAHTSADEHRDDRNHQDDRNQHP